jgi:flagellar basal body-associated protein FliL
MEKGGALVPNAALWERVARLILLIIIIPGLVVAAVIATIFVFTFAAEPSPTARYILGMFSCGHEMDCKTQKK